MKKTVINHWPWAAFGFVALMILVLPIPVIPHSPNEHTFVIQAKQFEYSPAVLKVEPGDKVTLELEASDVVHGLSIDGYDLEMTADPGQNTRMSFVADRQGTFRFRCTVTCGNLHPFMIGKLYVGDNTLFWKASALTLLVAGIGLWRLRK